MRAFGALPPSSHRAKYAVFHSLKVLWGSPSLCCRRQYQNAVVRGRYRTILSHDARRRAQAAPCSSFARLRNKPYEVGLMSNAHSLCAPGVSR